MAAKLLIRGTVVQVYDSPSRKDYGEVTDGPDVMRSASLLSFTGHEVEISVTAIPKAGDK
jgi:hypothetical protein